MLRRMPRHALLRSFDSEVKRALDLGFWPIPKVDRDDLNVSITMIPGRADSKERTRQEFIAAGGDPTSHPDGVPFAVAKIWDTAQPPADALHECLTDALERAKELMA